MPLSEHEQAVLEAIASSLFSGEEALPKVRVMGQVPVRSEGVFPEMMTTTPPPLDGERPARDYGYGVED